MTRLPSPGGDNGNWGNLLNEYLTTGHNPNGTNKGIYNVKDYGAIGDGKENLMVWSDNPRYNGQHTNGVPKQLTADKIGIQKAIDAAGKAGGGIIYFPPGTYIVNMSIIPGAYVNNDPNASDPKVKMDYWSTICYSNIWMRGAGIDATIIKCTSAIQYTDKQDIAETMDVFYIQNYQQSRDIPDQTIYSENIWISDMTVDCTAQNQKMMKKYPREHFLFGRGGAQAAIEFQNIHYAKVMRVKVIKGFGNAVLIVSNNPARSAAVLSGVIEDCIFVDCLQDVLEVYAITGSVIQYGAMEGGVIRNCQFINSGGPAIDIFTCRGTIVENNYFSGGKVDYVTDSTGEKRPSIGFEDNRPQAVNSIHSDFGLIDCIIRNNIFENAGPIVLRGIYLSIFQNDYTPEPGPHGCIVSGNIFRGTVTSKWNNPPPVPASGQVQVNQTKIPMMLRIVGGSVSSTNVTNNGNSQAVNSNHYILLLPNTGIQLNYSAKPSWEWSFVPNIQYGAIDIKGGGNQGVAKQNIFQGNIISECPNNAINLYSSQSNIINANIITNPGTFFPGMAFSLLKDGANSSSGNTFNNNQVTNSIGNLIANYSDNGDSGAVNNRLINNRLEKGSQANVLSSTIVQLSGNFGPGAQ